jgi:hypothetical protein
MQYQPNAAEILATIAELLEDELLPALPIGLQSRCRAAVSLTRILQRDEELNPRAQAREHARLTALLGHQGNALELSRELVERIRTDDDPTFRSRAWRAVAAITRDDLAIAAPGYDAWEGP